MNEWETLAEIDHAMMQVDIDMMEWQGNLDMAALAGVGEPFELWTDDDPPVKVTAVNAEETLIGKKPVRVMHFVNGMRTQVGTAEIDPKTGALSATITKAVPGVTERILNEFSIDREGRWNWLPAYQDLVNAPGSGVVEIAEPDVVTQYADDLPWVETIETHPFFDKE